MHRKEGISRLLAEFNASLPDDRRIDIEAVVTKLIGLGAGVPAIAAEISFEDIAGAGVPMPVARAIANLWRAAPAAPAPAAEPKAGDPMVQIGGLQGGIAELALAIGNVDSLNDGLLLANYQPMGRDDIISALNRRAENKPFIVFADKASLRIDVERSLALLMLLKQGIDVGSRTSVNGKMVELHRAGELPDQALSICPIHGNHLVGEAEFCNACHRGWSEIQRPARELAYLQTQEVWGETPPSGDARIDLMFQALDDIRGGYWADAILQAEKWANTGRPIVLVKPIDRRQSVDKKR
ncbi:hypothetical protein A2348_03150 [Candidatus Uhrbacteria bacterium RIFOXYB12_FULL_58_10]|uniref:Uncharacterized protein n=1 Tax=Candidatus Uhrbacteria bacterium RIFOXYB2_FULL_57_15 TaxID=1802422 RepID=A0A1F7W6G6_9BACT|nr:MAG: hypothetical protein A2348_03150 [Candidatus Uhrbacteria bacterium RIFOXYB12_FULL_58_10]OGL97958.1 MAG: hypothetical protein A2304_05390 [Candidatus Uhrbacteria bacterium RIFOXYB2_FULL_57_15]